MKVRNLKIRKIIATNVQKTIELELETSKGIVRSSVPIGTSRSKYEVVFLDVEDVIRKFSLIKKHFLTREFKSQKDVDSFLRFVMLLVVGQELGQQTYRNSFLYRFTKNRSLIQ